MAGRSRWRNQWLIRCGLVVGVLCGGSTSQGLELVMAQRGGMAWGCGIGMPFAPAVQHVSTEQSQDGFVVSASGTAIQDTPAGEAIKLMEAGQWVKAIQAIESLSETDQGLVLDERGVLRPLSAMKSALIASMPQAGRRTFCKLNDPAANTKLAEALAATDPLVQARSFKAVVDDYALCDAAAQAARHMGGIRFEQGRFNEAATYYAFAAQHPATTADDPALMARRLTALARAKQWSAFDELAEYARFRHAETTIQIAGQDTPLRQFITQLAAARGQAPADQPAIHADRLALPKAAEHEYDRPLIDEDQLKLLRQLAQNNNFGSIIDQAIAPVVVSDNDRLFALAVGQVVRLNPETGTALWQFGNTQQGVQAIQSRMHYLATGYHQSLTLHGNTLLAAVPHNKNVSQSHLIALDAETGEEQWSLRDTLRRNNESVVGTPLVVDDRIYFVSYKTTQEVTLRVVKLSDGTEISTLALGKASKGPNVNAPAELSPRLTMGQSHLLVQTNNGAMIAVEPHTMKIAWAYSQKIRPSGIGMMRRRGFAVANAIAQHTGDVVAVDGVVISKDTRTNRVVAFREYDAAMIWQAEADADATIVHLDDQHVYVLGKELVAHDRRTGERVWWTPHPGERSGQPVFTENACLIAGGDRLCRIDLTTGKLTHYREDIAQTAALHVVGQQLISVTPKGIAAMSLP